MARTAFLCSLVQHVAALAQIGQARPQHVGGFARLGPLSPVRPRIGCDVVAMDGGALATFDAWLLDAPYQSAFWVTALKASLADVLTQTREQNAVRRRLVEKLAASSSIETDSSNKRSAVLAGFAVLPAAGDGASSGPIDTVDSSAGTVDAAPEALDYSLRRTLAFFLYGGLYQGCAQNFFFNVCFPVWFGMGTDFATVVTKVCFDQFVLTPFLCLPTVYVVKAILFNYSPLEGLRRYTLDAKRDLLVKYWLLWTPVQFLTFSVVPPQWRITFIALVSFVWLLVLSSIVARPQNE